MVTSAARMRRSASSQPGKPTIIDADAPSLVDALASQVYVKRENERLFQETLEQRSRGGHSGTLREHEAPARAHQVDAAAFWPVAALRWAGAVGGKWRPVVALREEQEDRFADGRFGTLWIANARAGAFIFARYQSRDSSGVRRQPDQ